MSSIVIVAIPKEDDYVYKISSEKIPHMTLLYLGEADTIDSIANLGRIIEFVKHAATVTLNDFTLQVDRRGKLGDESADVLFFYPHKNILNFRSNLLKNNDIRSAYESVDQFPEWISHLTLGFPETPAKPDTRDYPGFYSVTFDRIAVWFGDYSGIEFPLKSVIYDPDVAMSNVTKTAVDDVLEHFGVKGMKWGVRRAGPSGPTGVTVRDSGKKLKTSGGKGLPAHSDAISARTIGQKGKGSGLKTLSNKELEEYTRRMSLEANVKRINYANSNVGKKFVLTLIGQTGKNQASIIANDVAATQVKKHLTKKLIKAGAVAAA